MTTDHSDLAAYERDLAEPTPARLWWHLPCDHPAVARALRIDASTTEAWFAMLPFRYFKQEAEGEPTRHLILAAHPAPDIGAMDWLDIETVLAWEPATGRYDVVGFDAPQLVGRITEMDNIAFGDPRAFFTAWAALRAQYLAARNSQPGYDGPIPDLTPGALIVGDPDKIAWPIYTMPPRFTCTGIDPKRVNRAILKFAKLPMCAGLETMKAVA